MVSACQNFVKVIRIQISKRNIIISWINKLVWTPLQINDCVLAIMLLLVDIVFEKKKKAHVDIADDKSKSSSSRDSEQRSSRPLQSVLLGAVACSCQSLSRT